MTSDAKTRHCVLAVVNRFDKCAIAVAALVRWKKKSVLPPHFKTWSPLWKRCNVFLKHKWHKTASSTLWNMVVVVNSGLFSSILLALPNSQWLIYYSEPNYTSNYVDITWEYLFCILNKYFKKYSTKVLKEEISSCVLYIYGISFFFKALNKAHFKEAHTEEKMYAFIPLMLVEKNYLLVIHTSVLGCMNHD